MGSQLDGIFNALAAISIDFTYDTVDYSVDCEDWQKPRATISLTPTRVLAPLSTNPEGNISKIALGKRGSAKWVLSDILLWRNIKSGRGIETDYPALTHYLMAYTNTMLANRFLINNDTGSATISDVQLTIVTQRYGNEDYAAVIAVLDIMETFIYA